MPNNNRTPYGMPDEYDDIENEFDIERYYEEWREVEEDYRYMEEEEHKNGYNED